MYDYVLITHAYAGAKDLSYGIPNMKGAVCVEVMYEENRETGMVFELTDGKRVLIKVSPA